MGTLSSAESINGSLDRPLRQDLFGRSLWVAVESRRYLTGHTLNS